MAVDVDVWAGDIYAGSLPQICVLTGEPTPGVHSVRYSTTPRWVIALLFAGVLPYVVAVFLLRRQVTGTLPMCCRALRRFVIQRAASVAVTVLSIAGLGLAIADSSAGFAAPLALASLLTLFVGGAVCLLWSGFIGIAGRVDDRPGWGRWVRLRGVNPTFAAAVRQLYAGRLPEWQVGTVPASFIGVPIPDGYAPSWTPFGPWQPGAPAATPPAPSRAG